MYGHMDKQPFGEGWKHPPCDPVIENGKLNGRGSSDDCYAFYSALLAVKSCQENSLPHPRVVITIEGNEEGGSLDDLKYYMQTYRDTLIGEPNVVICLDSDAFSEDTLVISSSLRGCLIFDLHVQTFLENVHSGGAGIIPDPYMIATNLINRLIDFKSHKLIKEFEVDIPEYRKLECMEAAKKLPLISHMIPAVPTLTSIAKTPSISEVDENYHLILNSTWLPQLTVTAIEGMPSSLADASNSIKKSVTVRCSVRLPPSLPVEKAIQIVKDVVLLRG
jgi:acetylornithine deacetylase/succinyl-diaminopimelate desuccinylase-like protein